MWKLIEAYLRRRFVALHGEGEAHQADVYRCQSCGKMRTWRQLRDPDTHGVCCMGRVIPATPTMWEAVKLLALPWMVR